MIFKTKKRDGAAPPEKPVIHLYTICWNEEFMLPFFFRHYDEFVDRYVVYDDGSTDNTISILRAHPKVELRSLPHPGADSHVLAARELRNNCWKESKGNASWVIITAIDEHLYHVNLADYLIKSREKGVTLIPAIGFQMLSTVIPEPGEKLSDRIIRGAPFTEMNKLSLFDPDRIEDTNFTVGRHEAFPTGKIVLPKHDEILNLHYKYLSFDRTYFRHTELQGKLRALDKENQWGIQYAWSKEKLQNEWDGFEKNAHDDVRQFSNYRNRRRVIINELWWRKKKKRKPLENLLAKISAGAGTIEKLVSRNR
jgi:glycosyltransferase involved in cell wall biosynthesis